MAANEQQCKSKEAKQARIPQNFALILSSPLFQTPPFKLTNNNNNTLIHDIHKSLISTKDFLFGLFSRNPFLHKLHNILHEVQCGRVKRVSCLPSRKFAAILPGDSVAEIVVTNGILNFLNIYNTVLVVRLVLTWFPNTPPAIVSPLSTLCDPYLNIFRGIIPPLGGTLDLSPILAFVVLNAFTSAAAALPCELPKADGGIPQRNLSSQKGFNHLNTSQRLWMRRLCRNKLKRSDNAN